MRVKTETQMMKTVAYVLSLLLVAPSTLLAAFFALVGHAAAQKSLIELIISLLQLAYEFLAWGAWVVMAAIAALFVAGFVARLRVWGAAVSLAIGLISLSIIVGMAGLPQSLGEAVFHAPGLASMGINAWLLKGGLKGAREQIEFN